MKNILATRDSVILNSPNQRSRESIVMEAVSAAYSPKTRRDSVRSRLQSALSPSRRETRILMSQSQMLSNLERRNSMEFQSQAPSNVDQAHPFSGFDYVECNNGGDQDSLY